MTITIRKVINHADKIAFLKVPFPIYADDKNWVAPLFLERLEHLNPKKNPYFAHAKAQLFIAEKDGSPVGRISAQIDQLHLQRYHDGVGQFGFLEAIDDTNVFHKLLTTASDWLRAEGMQKIRGPFSFSVNDETGLLVDGFHSPPSMMMGHARNYYQSHVEANGLKKVKSMYAFDYPTIGKLPPALERLHARALNSGDITVRNLDKKYMARDIAIIMDIFNDAWSGNWGYVPFTPAELNALGNNLKILVSNEYVAIASYKGEPAAMSITLPNINDWLAGLNGKLLPFGWAKLGWNLFAKPPRAVRMPLMGVRKKFQDTMTGTGLALTVIEKVRTFHVSRGTLIGELSWILEDNKGMVHIAEALGAKLYKTYSVFEKQL